MGHICLPWHATSEYWCTLSDIQNYRPDRAVEREANEFAAELLLPERVLREHLKRRPPSVALAQEIANEYGTSLTATLLSIVGLSDDDFCAVVLSGDDGVKWSFSSPPLRKCGTLPTRGQPVPADSLAATALAGWPGPNEPSPVPESTWVQGWTGGLLGHVMEHALYSPDLGTVLSFLFLPEATFVGED